MSYLRDFNMAAFWAGVTGFVWYAFGTVPLHIAVSSQLGLTTAQSSSWMFIVWFSGAISSIALSLRFRQPIPITWTMPGLVSAFWAVVVGLIVALTVERSELLAHWRGAAPEKPTT